MRAAREIPRHAGAHVAGSRGRHAPVFDRCIGAPRLMGQSKRPFSDSSMQSTQYGVHGTASSLFSGIGFPQFEQSP